MYYSVIRQILPLYEQLSSLLFKKDKFGCKLIGIYKIFWPYGQFLLQDTDHKAICVAGGVGLAPMKPIIYETLRNYPDRTVELYYGARTFEDLYDHQMLTELARKHEKFQYYPALSDSAGSDLQYIFTSKGFLNGKAAALHGLQLQAGFP